MYGAGARVVYVLAFSRSEERVSSLSSLSLSHFPPISLFLWLAVTHWISASNVLWKLRGSLIRVETCQDDDDDDVLPLLLLPLLLSFFSLSLSVSSRLCFFSRFSAKLFHCRARSLPIRRRRVAVDRQKCVSTARKYFPSHPSSFSPALCFH